MKLFRKSFLFVLLSFVILLGGCGVTEPVDDPDNQDNRDNPENPDNNRDNNVPVESSFEVGTLGYLRDQPIFSLTANEMTRLMGHGVNLGNTMEACGAANRQPMQDPGVYERMWGQPTTTQESINGMKEAGFSTLRIPVAWTNAMSFAVGNKMDYENWDFTIDPRYLDRVEEIVNYALDAGMIAIVNNHWDHGWWSMFGHPEQEIRDLAMEIYTTMWTQVAERFNHFDGRLILESANEELGDRLNDKTPFSPTGGTLTENEQYEMTTVINQRFIDIVRGTGGNNAERFLLVKGFHTDVLKTMDDRYVMPLDPAGKLILGVHYYTPWSYCGDTSGVGGWGTSAEIEEMNNLLGMLTKFTEQGYGILIGEWGVLDNVGEDRFNFFTHFLALADKHGYATTLWDTGGVYSRTEFRIKARQDDDDAIDKLAGLFKSVAVESRLEMTVEDIIFDAEMTLVQSQRRAESRPQFTYSADEAFAWIMYACSDWTIQYSNQDQYRPDSAPGGLIATDVEVTGAGTYTVALDFTKTDKGYANGFEFAAVGIVNAEVLWPGYIIEFTEVLINGEPVEPEGVPYTTNDNPVTTRVNIYNQWVPVSNIDLEKARTPDGDLNDITATPYGGFKNTRIETISITFDYYEG
ncbi:MAG: glycoside hydrolase family 5 protein [Oscillospiraceae bacterium]|nr:glycoside hydrolase family 5 protein [Oscillospiraceae bacterium]